MINSKNLIPYGSQKINKTDFTLIKKSLKNSLITTGPFVKLFEKKTSKFLESKYSFTCSSGTSALHLAYLSIGLKKNDIIILPAINFVAASNMASSLGAKIYFSDVDVETGQTSPEHIKKCIKKNNIKKIKAIVTMYNGGFPRNVIKFYELKKKYKCYLIEDACHAFGAKYFYKNIKYSIGSCKHSDISTFSFHPLKTITTGEGGLITTNNKSVAKKIIELRSHGIKKDKLKYWSYDVNSVGFNYRLSDINAALGVSQLKNINKILKRRKEIFLKYLNMLDNYMNIISILKPEPRTEPAYHLVLANINFSKLNVSKNKFIKKLLEKKIISQFHYIPNYEFSIYKKKFKKLAGCEKYKVNSLSLPIHLKIDNKKQEFIINTIKSIIKKCKKK